MRGRHRIPGRREYDETEGARGPVVAPPSPALLRDARLGSSQMAPVRAQLARRVQHSAGNRGFGRVLARNGGPPTPAPAAPALKTGKDVDAMLLASDFFKPYVEPKMKKGTKAEGNVHIHAAAAFKTEVLKYLKGKENPETGKEFTDAEAEAFEPKVRGFQDTDTGQIHVHETRGDSGTVVHEAMHLFSHATFVNTVGYHANEGTTEIFARKLCAANSIPRAGYPSQYRSVMKVVALSSETMLADAYFDNKITPVKDKVDAAKGAGTWDKWLGFMKAGKFADADALL
jgi:hypothetical protein